jgi:hypothetical protein
MEIAMKLTILRGDEKDCSGGTCPTVYLAEDGDLVVQGYVLDDATASNLVHVAPGESAIKISAKVVLSALEAYRSQR